MASPGSPSSAVKGEELEERVARFFAAQGYSVARNAVLEGRSGAAHEVDVLARRADGVADIRIAVECKAWDEPVDKAAIAKLAYVIADLGLNKGVVVSAGGFRLGALRAAEQLGIDLWGPEEIEAKLTATSAEVGERVLGLSPAVPEPKLAAVLRAQSRGVLGLGREEVRWARLLWLPCHLLEVRCAYTVKDFLRRPALRTEVRWNLYCALDDTYLAAFREKPQAEELVLPAALPPRTRPSRLAAALGKALARTREAVRPDARERAAERLAALGIPAYAEHLAVESVELWYLPYYAGLLRRRDAERIVAVDARDGRPSEVVSAILTGQLGYVAASAAPPDAPGPG